MDVGVDTWGDCDLLCFENPTELARCCWCLEDCWSWLCWLLLLARMEPASGVPILEGGDGLVRLSLCQALNLTVTTLDRFLKACAGIPLVLSLTIFVGLGDSLGSLLCLFNDLGSCGALREAGELPPLLLPEMVPLFLPGPGRPPLLLLIGSGFLAKIRSFGFWLKRPLFGLDELSLGLFGTPSLEISLSLGLTECSLILRSLVSLGLPDPSFGLPKSSLSLGSLSLGSLSLGSLSLGFGNPGALGCDCDPTEGRALRSDEEAAGDVAFIEVAGVAGAAATAREAFSTLGRGACTEMLSRRASFSLSASLTGLTDLGLGGSGREADTVTVGVDFATEGIGLGVAGLITGFTTGLTTGLGVGFGVGFGSLTLGFTTTGGRGLADGDAGLTGPRLGFLLRFKVIVRLGWSGFAADADMDSA